MRQRRNDSTHDAPRPAREERGPKGNTRLNHGRGQRHAGGHRPTAPKNRWQSPKRGINHPTNINPNRWIKRERSTEQEHGHQGKTGKNAVTTNGGTRKSKQLTQNTKTSKTAGRGTLDRTTRTEEGETKGEGQIQMLRSAVRVQAAPEVAERPTKQIKGEKRRRGAGGERKEW